MVGRIHPAPDPHEVQAVPQAQRLLRAEPRRPGPARRRGLDERVDRRARLTGRSRDAPAGRAPRPPPTSPTCSASPAGSTRSATGPGNATSSGCRRLTAPSTSRSTGTTPAPVPCPSRRRSASRMAIECPGAGLAEPIGYSAVDRAGLWAQLSGRTAVATSWRPRAGRAADAPRSAEPCGCLHDTPTDLLPSSRRRGPRRPGGDRLDHPCRRAHRHAGPAARGRLPDDRRRRRRRARRTCPPRHRRSRTATSSPTTCSRSATQVRLLDLDRCGPADPALDLAKFAADLHWWCAPDSERARALTDELPCRIRRVRPGALGPSRPAHPAVRPQAHRPPLRRALPRVGRPTFARVSPPPRPFWRGVRDGEHHPRRRHRLPHWPTLDPSLASLPPALPTCSRHGLMAPARRPLDAR